MGATSRQTRDERCQSTTRLHGKGARRDQRSARSDQHALASSNGINLESLLTTFPGLVADRVGPAMYRTTLRTAPPFGETVVGSGFGRGVRVGSLIVFFAGALRSGSA